MFGLVVFGHTFSTGGPWMSRVQGGLKAESQLDAGDVFSIFGEDVGLCLSFFFGKIVCQQ